MREDQINVIIEKVQEFIIDEEYLSNEYNSPKNFINRINYKLNYSEKTRKKIRNKYFANMHKIKMSIEFFFSWLKIYRHKSYEYMMINTNISTKAIWKTLT